MTSGTIWHPYGRGYQASVRDPYHDLEVQPSGDGWRWRVLRMDAAHGSFESIASGHAKKLHRAQALAVAAAVTKAKDWADLIEAELKSAGLTSADLNRALVANRSRRFGALDRDGLERLYLWLVNDYGLEIVGAAVGEPS
jgi:hypothetical protein